VVCGAVAPRREAAGQWGGRSVGLPPVGPRLFPCLGCARGCFSFFPIRHLMDVVCPRFRYHGKGDFQGGGLYGPRVAAAVPSAAAEYAWAACRARESAGGGGTGSAAASNDQILPPDASAFLSGPFRAPRDHYQLPAFPTPPHRTSPPFCL